MQLNNNITSNSLGNRSKIIKKMFTMYKIPEQSTIIYSCQLWLIEVLIENRLKTTKNSINCPELICDVWNWRKCG